MSESIAIISFLWILVGVVCWAQLRDERRRQRQQLASERPTIEVTNSRLT